MKSFLLATVMLGTLVSQANAQATKCADRQSIVSELKNQHREVPRQMGLASNGFVIEVFVSPERNFTLVMTQPNGTTCLIGAGKNWETLPAVLKGVSS